MTNTMWIICLQVLLNGFFFEMSEAQTSLSYFAEDTVELSCPLSGTFTFPVWRGPPSSTKYTLQDDDTGTINSAALAYGRLKYDSDNKTLLLSRAVTDDSGSYSCSYGGIGSHTITLTVSEKKCTCDCNCKKTCKGIVIPSIVFGSLGAISIPVVIGGTVTEHFGRITALVVDVIGIVFDVISLGLGIGVQGQDCCENAEDCCEDSDCCEVECEKNWIETTALVFIIIGILVGIASGVIFYLVWSGRIGRGNNGGNGFFCFNNGNDDGNDGGNDSGNNGHHRGRGTNSSTVHTECTDTHRGTLSDRANSDGEVSRKDVHVQENRDNFSGRPMPPIPLTDKKGRGLSANYDDDHPMITVGIPERRAGDLGPLAEEPKKKKKKKKKQVNDDDDE